MTHLADWKPIAASDLCEAVKELRCDLFDGPGPCFTRTATATPQPSTASAGF